MSAPICCPPFCDTSAKGESGSNLHIDALKDVLTTKLHTWLKQWASSYWNWTLHTWLKQGASSYWNWTIVQQGLEVCEAEKKGKKEAASMSQETLGRAPLFESLVFQRVL